MKNVLLWDPRFPDRRPARLALEDTVASAAVRAGVATAANASEAGILSAGGALDPTMLTEVVIQHGYAGGTRRVFLPYSVVLVGALAGVLAAIGTPVAGAVAPPPTPTPTPGDAARFGSLMMSGKPGYATVGAPYAYSGPATVTAIDGSAVNGPLRFGLFASMPVGVAGYVSDMGALDASMVFNTGTGAITSSGILTAGFTWSCLTVTELSTGRTGFMFFGLSRGPSYTQLMPSGDPSGNTDLAAINAYTRNNQRVRLAATAPWYGNGAIEFNSNAGLIGAPGLIFNHAASTNTNLLRNVNRGSRTRQDTNILVHMEGANHFNGLASPNQLTQDPGRLSTGFLWVSAEGIQISGPVGVKATAPRMCNMLIGTAHVDMDLDFASTGSVNGVAVVNQDGLDIFNGSSRGNFNLRGRVDDDAVSIKAAWSASPNSGVAGTPWDEVTTSEGDVHSLWFEGPVECRDENYFRWQDGNGLYAYRIKGRGIEDTYTGANAKRFMMVGQRKYIRDSATNGPARDREIEFEGLKGFDRYLSLEADIRGLGLRKINQNIRLVTGISVERTETETYNPVARAVSIDGITDTYRNAADPHGILLAIPKPVDASAPADIDGLSITNFAFGSLARVEWVVAGAAKVEALKNVTLQGTVATATNLLFASNPASTGAMNVVVGNRDKVANGQLYETSIGYKLGAQQSKIGPFDAIPLPTAGSLATFTNGTGPTGATFFLSQLGGDYVGSGTVWTVQGTVRDVPYPDPHTYFLDNFTDTAELTLASHMPDLGAAYTTLPGSSNTTPMRIDASGQAVYSGASPTGYRAGGATIGAAQETDLTLTDFAAARSTDLPTLVTRSISGQTTHIQMRWNESSQVYEAIKFVAGTPTPLETIAGARPAGGKMTLRVVPDKYKDATKLIVQMKLNGVLLGAGSELTDAVFLTNNSFGAPGLKGGSIQGTASGLHPTRLEARTV